MVRGGGWNPFARPILLTVRGRAIPDERSPELGARVCRTLEGIKERLEAEMEVAHRKRVERDWEKVKKITKGDGKNVINKIKAFLKSYNRHERGNPLKDQAYELFIGLCVKGGRCHSSGVEWVKIPAGSFMMGSTDGKPNEYPVHEVTLKSFFISRTEVTVGQYRACVKAGKCSKPNTSKNCNWGKSTRDHYPINCIDWNKARSFAKWVGGDLCSESEWEYSARAGEDFKYAGSNDPEEVGWYQSNSEGSTHSVGKKKKNAWGLYDMSGNVDEWTLDKYKDSYSGAPTNGLPVCLTPTCRKLSYIERTWREFYFGIKSLGRVVRGGSWDGNALFLRVADRHGQNPSENYKNLGARLCRRDK